MDRRWAVGLAAAVVVGLAGVRVAVERLARADPRLPGPAVAGPRPLPPPLSRSPFPQHSPTAPKRTGPPAPVAGGPVSPGDRPDPGPATPAAERDDGRARAGLAVLAPTTGRPAPSSVRDALAREGFGEVAAAFDGRRTDARRARLEGVRQLRALERELGRALRDAPEDEAVWIREQLVRVRAQRKEAKRVARAPSNGSATTPGRAAR